ncbi:hypothetical protein FPRO06_13835 [Fusarium proliferatum]|nr:hypothetical protein FPRO06_13835 [Fusarium proliferatum]
MLVKLKTPNAPNRAILKLHDREFGSSLRSSKKDKHLPCPADWRLESGGQAKFEAALWWETRTHFETEVEAYKRLKDIQGLFIPRMYASIRCLTTSASASKNVDDYYSVNDILLQFIPGRSLWDLPESPSSPTSQQEWASIVQRIVQGAHEINKREVILNDSCPRNVAVDADSHQPFIIDLAQCYFKDQLFKD